jgi:hypothetical protein
MLFAFAVMTIVAGLFIAFFAFPEELRQIRRGRFFADGVGRHVFLPVLIAFPSAFAWRAAALAFGSRPAIELGSDAAYVNTLSGRHRIAWGDLAGVALAQDGANLTIMFRTRSPGRFGRSEHGVNLSATDLHPNRIDEFLARIEHRRASAGTIRRPAAPPQQPPEALPVRPAFGRKRA